MEVGASLPVAELQQGVANDACLMVVRSGSVPKSVSGLIRSVGLQKKPVVEVGAIKSPGRVWSVGLDLYRRVSVG